MRRAILFLMLMAWVFAVSARAEDSLTGEQAVNALHQAVTFFRDHVSAEGGYLWQYSADLTRQEGEGRATESSAWVQPPGTPTVGEALLFAFEATGDTYYLQTARQTGQALVRGQLQSGGWDYRIEINPAARKRYRYRIDEDRPGARNVTTLDDDTTQSALRFLIHLDRTLSFQDDQIHAAAEYALTSLLQAQYPNGAWPQRFSEPPDPQQHPIRKASYPDSWSRTHPEHDYRSYYTFNDNTIADMIDTLFQAAEVYGQSRYVQAAEKAGDFILLAQMPEPQSAWAQQYNAEMQPAWARRFEPPAVTGGESQGVIRVLLQLYRHTGRKKYLEPIPSALDYLEESLLPNGQLARFYELKSNRPLYFTKQYELTYSDADMPTHYGFKTGANLKRLRLEYERLLKTRPDDLKPVRNKPVYQRSRQLVARAQAAVAELDQRGAWVEEGRLRSYGSDDSTTRVISSRTFVSNVETLSRFIAAGQ